MPKGAQIENRPLVVICRYEFFEFDDTLTSSLDMEVKVKLGIISVITQKFLTITCSVSVLQKL